MNVSMSHHKNINVTLQQPLKNRGLLQNEPRIWEVKFALVFLGLNILLNINGLSVGITNPGVYMVIATFTIGYSTANTTQGLYHA